MRSPSLVLSLVNPLLVRWAVIVCLSDLPLSAVPCLLTFLSTVDSDRTRRVRDTLLAVVLRFNRLYSLVHRLNARPPALWDDDMLVTLCLSRTTCLLLSLWTVVCRLVLRCLKLCSCRLVVLRWVVIVLCLLTAPLTWARSRVVPWMAKQGASRLCRRWLRLVDLVVVLYLLSWCMSGASVLNRVCVVRIELRVCARLLKRPTKDVI